jgi:hypothetical protein
LVSIILCHNVFAGHKQDFVVGEEINDSAIFSQMSFPKNVIIANELVEQANATSCQDTIEFSIIHIAAYHPFFTRPYSIAIFENMVSELLNLIVPRLFNCFVYGPYTPEFGSFSSGRNPLIFDAHAEVSGWCGLGRSVGGNITRISKMGIAVAKFISQSYAVEDRSDISSQLSLFSVGRNRNLSSAGRPYKYSNCGVCSNEQQC